MVFIYVVFDCVHKYGQFVNAMGNNYTWSWLFGSLLFPRWQHTPCTWIWSSGQVETMRSLRPPRGWLYSWPSSARSSGKWYDRSRTVGHLISVLGVFIFVNIDDIFNSIDVSAFTGCVYECCVLLHFLIGIVFRITSLFNVLVHCKMINNQCIWAIWSIIMILELTKIQYILCIHACTSTWKQCEMFGGCNTL